MGEIPDPISTPDPRPRRPTEIDEVEIMERLAREPRPSQRARDLVENLSCTNWQNLGAGELADAENLILNYIANLESRAASPLPEEPRDFDYTGASEALGLPPEEPPASELVEHAKDVMARGYIDSEGFARGLIALSSQLERQHEEIERLKSLGVNQEGSTTRTTDARPAHDPFDNVGPLDGFFAARLNPPYPVRLRPEDE